MTVDINLDSVTLAAFTPNLPALAGTLAIHGGEEVSPSGRLLRLKRFRAPHRKMLARKI